MRIAMLIMALFMLAIPASAKGHHGGHYMGHRYSHHHSERHSHIEGYRHKHHHRRYHSHRRHHVRHHGHYHNRINSTIERNVKSFKLVTIKTAAGTITVANHLAVKFKGLIADFVAHGYKPRHVGCFARGGHVPNSRHYSGAACDFDQSGWGKTSSFMYHASALIKKHGLRDGCLFSDCGHVDDGVPLRGHKGWHRHIFYDDE